MKSKVKKLTSTMLFIGGLSLLGSSPTYAQESDSARLADLEGRTSKLEVLKGLKVSGYFQGQFQYGQEKASLKVGSANTDETKGFSRIGVRRGRIKFTYDKKIASAVFQFDLTEKGVSFKDVYMQIKDPKFTASSIKVGVFDRPFGYEITYSSSRRESPERSTVFTTLFPNERDLGVMLTLQAKKGSAWNILKLDAGLFAGNGIKADIKNRKDFIGRLSVKKSLKEIVKIGGGVSYYNGGVYQGTPNIYKLSDKKFVVASDSLNIGKYAKREYMGVDFQLGVHSILGETSIAGEFLTGTQPGEKGKSKSPNNSAVGTTDTYIRNFYGAYACLVQDFGPVPLSAVVKYDWYDPNIKISKDEIGLNGTGKGDISYQTIGCGLIWKINNELRATAYYEVIQNEKSKNLKGYEEDIKDDVFTFRLQYKF